MNIRAISDLTKQIDHYSETSLKYSEKKKQIDARLTATFQTISSYVESFKELLELAAEKKDSLSAEEYATYLKRFIEEYAFNNIDSDCSDSDDENNLDPATKPLTTLIHLKTHLNEIDIQVDPEEINQLTSALVECQKKLWHLFSEYQDYEFTKIAKQTENNPEVSSDTDEKNAVPRKRKFEEVYVSNNPDTLFASESKKAKLEGTPDNFVLKQ